MSVEGNEESVKEIVTVFILYMLLAKYSGVGIVLRGYGQKHGQKHGHDRPLWKHLELGLVETVIKKNTMGSIQIELDREPPSRNRG